MYTRSDMYQVLLVLGVMMKIKYAKSAPLLAQVFIIISYVPV